MAYNLQYFQKCEFAIKDKHFKYYSSPNLVKIILNMVFLQIRVLKWDICSIKTPKYKNKNCVLNQIHSNKIVIGSKTQGIAKIEADGLINDRRNQNLWIYTADCMPILIADKRRRSVAAIHCGRRGLETK